MNRFAWKRSMAAALAVVLVTTHWSFAGIYYCSDYAASQGCDGWCSIFSDNSCNVKTVTQIVPKVVGDEVIYVNEVVSRSCLCLEDAVIEALPYVDNKGLFNVN